MIPGNKTRSGLFIKTWQCVQVEFSWVCSMELFLVFALLLWQCSGQLVQDTSIYGKFEQAVVAIDARERAQVLAKCFWGLGFPTCMATLQDDDIVQQRNLVYYNEMPDNYGANYCLACCGEHENKIDTWDLMCDMDIQTASESNVYGYELRLASNQYDGDQTVITCPLKRSACSYEADGTTLISCVGDDTYLVGYTLTLSIQKYDQNFNYWRGIASCTIEAEESTTPLASGDQFRETIVMEYPFDWAHSLDFAKPVLVLTALVFFAYMLLYFCRRKRCCFCQAKLVWSEDMCIRCKFVGADPPDPVLLAALESKGEHAQGLEPERFPGSTRAIAFARRTYKDAGRLWNARRIYAEKAAEEAEKKRQSEEEQAEKDALEQAQKDAAADEAGLFTHDDSTVGGDSVNPEGRSPIVDPEHDAAQAGLEGDEEEQKEEKKEEEGQGEGEGVGERRDEENGKEDREGSGSKKEEGSDKKEGDKDKDKDEAAVPYKKPWLPKWKYPRWMKRLGFGKNKNKAPRVNPNLLAFPEHVIYAAVGHHKPPAPDESMEKQRREMMVSALGYMPGEEVDEEGNVVVHDSDEDETEEISVYGHKRDTRTKYEMDGTPYWQQEMDLERSKIRKPPVEPDWWSDWGCEAFFMVSNPCKKTRAQKIAAQLRGRGKFKKKRNYYCCAEHSLPKVKHMAPFLGLFACIMLFVLITFVLLFTGLDFSGS